MITPDSDLSDSVGAQRGARKRGPKPEPLKVPKEQLEQLYRDFVSGETLAQVGSKVGMTAGSIDRQFEKAGLKSQEGTSQHWKSLMDQKADLYWGKRGRRPAHEKQPLLTKPEFEDLGESLQNRILHSIIAHARKKYRIELTRDKDMSDKKVRKEVREDMQAWDMAHGVDWAYGELPNG